MTIATNQVVEVKQHQILPGFGSMEGFELLKTQASLLAGSNLIPERFQKNPANCLIALNMANRINADPLMVMQNLYVVHGTPGWSAQFLIATFNTSGKFSAIRYEWIGKQGTDNWGCKAWAIEKSTGERLEGSPVTIEIAKREGWYDKKGSKWQTMPGQMLMYRSAAWFIRAYAPEIAMGMHTTDEIIDMTEDKDGKFIHKVEQNANKETLDFDNIEDAVVVEESKQESPSEPEPAQPDF